MKKLLLIFLLISIFGFSQSQKNQISEIKKFQKELNEGYTNPKETPLRGDNFTNFKQHPFFPIDLKYRVTAQLQRPASAEPFEIPTS